MGRDGTLIASMQQGGTRPDLRIVDTDADRTTTLPTLAEGWAGAGSWSPDDRFYAVGYAGGLVQLFDVTSGESVGTRAVLDGMVTEVSHSADGRHLVAADDAGGVVLLDAETLETIRDPVTVPEKIYAVTAGLDGRTAFVSAGGTRWRPFWDVPITHWYLLDLAAARIVRDGDVAVRNAIYSSFSPDGGRVAIGGRQGEVVVIDVGPVVPSAHRPSVTTVTSIGSTTTTTARWSPPARRRTTSPCGTAGAAGCSVRRSCPRVSGRPRVGSVGMDRS